MTSGYPRSSMSHFAKRRSRLMKSLNSGAIILTAGHDVVRNHDVDYEFRQQSSFWYLTGFEEPDAVAVLRPGHQEPYVLFVRPYDPKFEIWVGSRAGVDGATEIFGADAAYTLEQLDEELPKLLEDIETVYFSLGSDERMDKVISDLVRRRRASAQRGGRPLLSIEDPKPIIDQMRQIKSKEEITSLQHAIDITAQGFNIALRATRPGLYEYQVQAELEAEFRRLGSPRNGYPSIVASGANACILHYIKNRAQMKDGDLLLIDAGAEMDYYSADITRTWPANGRFTPEQRAVYEVVLEAQRKAFEAIAPTARFDEVHLAALRVLVQGLIDFGALEGEVDGLIEQKAYQPYYMHGTSHWLGLDVHDAGQYRVGETWVQLREGMVFTVEPGLYFGPQATDSPASLKGIGIRIEDDVLVTADGCRVLSAAVPSQVDQLESLVGASTK
jgi:Xaa-Pro aminopeptidase